MSINAPVHMHMCMSLCMSIRMSIRMAVHLSIHTHISMSVLMSALMPIHMPAPMFAHILYICLHTCLCTCAKMSVHTLPRSALCHIKPTVVGSTQATVGPLPFFLLLAQLQPRLPSTLQCMESARAGNSTRAAEPWIPEIQQLCAYATTVYKISANGHRDI